MKIRILALSTLAAFFLMTSCQKDSGVSSINVDNNNPDLEFGLGGRLDEDDSKVPSDLFLGNGNVPGSHDISQFLPPVGSQGNYGTCVSWALGYNLKTMLEAQDKNYTTSDLNDASKRFSAKDLFLSIDKNDVGANCDGTYLNSALTAMQNRGIATEATVPYTGLGDCSQSPSASGNNEAGNYRIENFRKIDPSTQTIKEYIANDRPVGFGAKLGDNFMNWNSDDVLTGHTTFDRVGQHAGHCMTVIGYDDSKGPNGAFRVINSWGDDWGNQGFIWIDYDFFTSSEFVHNTYVASNKNSDVDPNNPTDPTSNGQVDMVPWGLNDNADENGSSSADRTLSYNVYNVGSESANASKDWSVAYIYYNAFDANDYGIMLYDYYSDDFGSRGENGQMDSGPGSSGNWWNNVDVQGGQSISQAVNGSEDNFTWNYTIPNITGYYYLVMIADPFAVLNEKDMSNNYFYMTDSDGYPIWFENGIPQGLVGNKNTSRSATIGEQTISHLAPAEVSPEMANAYSKKEITDFLQAKKKNGQLRNAVRSAGFIKK